MQIQTVIDDNLFVLASRIAGVADARLLLEYALRLLIQVETSNEETTPPNAVTTGFAARLQQFRETTDLNQFIESDR